jgi:hypothetical protein
MPPLNAIQESEPKRPPLNLDYRFLSLVLFFATRADLFGDYLAGRDRRQREASWAKLLKLGLPHNLLAESLYLFELPETQRALRQIQLVSQTLVELNDYCSDSCPSDQILKELAWVNSKQTQPLSAAGTDMD